MCYVKLSLKYTEYTEEMQSLNSKGRGVLFSLLLFIVFHKFGYNNVLSGNLRTVKTDANACLTMVIRGKINTEKPDMCHR